MRYGTQAAVHYWLRETQRPRQRKPCLEWHRQYRFCFLTVVVNSSSVLCHVIVCNGSRSRIWILMQAHMTRGRVAAALGA